ncbi:MAG: hypothetical protein A2096_11805, partial [Spirochaetes bacterium GWF1_41_5]
MAEDFSQFLNVFLSEAAENLEVLETEIINLEEFPDNPDILNKIFRAAHTIKGSAGLVGLTELQDFTHHLEDFLENMRSGKTAVSREAISSVLSSIDIIKAMLKNIKGGSEAGNGLDYSQVAQSLSAHTQGSGKKIIRDAVSAAWNRFRITMELNRNIFRFGIDPLMFIDDLRKAGTLHDININETGLPEFENLDPSVLYIAWQAELESSRTIEDLKNIFLFVMDDSKITIEKIPENKKPQEAELHAPEALRERKTQVSEDSFIKVSSEKLDRLLNMISELVISQSQVNSIAEKIKGPAGEELRVVSSGMDKLSQSLQEHTMSLRMINLGPTFTKFRRLVRDLAAEHGKEARLEISGHDTELDKNMIAKIDDPLKHMIRNSVDHGIETIQARRAAGKAECGTVFLNAWYEAGSVVIEVRDDGAGINKKRLLAKAVEKQIISGNEELSDAEIYRLVFHPGLSTAEKVTDISGRGVGMDVVLSNVKELNGNVDIFSEPGKGTRFKITLPLTLAIIDGMLTGAGREVYIIPIITVEETYRPTSVQIKSVEGKGELVQYRNDFLPLIRLHRIFSIPDAVTDPSRALCVIVKNSG